MSRAAVAAVSSTHGGDGGGTGGGGEEEEPLLLGVSGRAFSFDADSPCQVTWTACTSAVGGSKGEGKGVDLAEVAEFITAAVSG